MMVLIWAKKDPIWVKSMKSVQRFSSIGEILIISTAVFKFQDHHIFLLCHVSFKSLWLCCLFALMTLMSRLIKTQFVSISDSRICILSGLNLCLELDIRRKPPERVADSMLRGKKLPGCV